MSTLSCWRDIGIQGDRSCPELKQLVHCRNCDRYIQGARSLFERPLADDLLPSLVTPSNRANSSNLTNSSNLANSRSAGAIAEQPLPKSAQNTAIAVSAASSLMATSSAQQPPEEEAVRNAMAIFRLGQEWFALPAGLFQQVISPTPVRPIPYRSDTLLQGLVNVRGELLLCIDLRALLKMPLTEAIAESGRFAIVKQDQHCWAFPVDEFQGIELISRSLLFAPPVSLRKAIETYTQSLFTWNQQSVNVLDETLLFNALSQKVTP